LERDDKLNSKSNDIKTYEKGEKRAKDVVKRIRKHLFLGQKERLKKHTRHAMNNKSWDRWRLEFTFVDESTRDEREVNLEEGGNESTIK